MSFYCNHHKSIVHNARRALVPIEVRKVNYIGTRKERFQRNVTTESEITSGTEIVKEVAVCEDDVKDFIAANPVRVVGEKTVMFNKPPKMKPKFIKPIDDAAEKGEFGE